MLTPIFLITDGPPDDRYLRAAFSTRGSAEAALHMADPGGEVVELVLDGPLPPAPMGLSLWGVQEYHGYLAVRLSAFGMTEEIGQVIDDGHAYNVYLWAYDEDDALAQGRELIQRAKE